MSDLKNKLLKLAKCSVDELEFPLILDTFDSREGWGDSEDDYIIKRFVLEVVKNDDDSDGNSLVAQVAVDVELADDTEDTGVIKYRWPMRSMQDLPQILPMLGALNTFWGLYN